MTRVSERRLEQKVLTRARVLEAALAIFRRDGVARARIEDVVELAGVSRGTFYFHFPTKDDVLAEMLKVAELQVADRIENLPPRASPSVILESMVKATMETWQDDPQLFPEVGMLALRLTAAGRLTGETDPVRAAVARRFARAAERGELARSVPPAQLADMFLLGAFAALMGWAKDPGGQPLEAVLRRVARLFLDGARA